MSILGKKKIDVLQGNVSDKLKRWWWWLLLLFMMSILHFFRSNTVTNIHLTWYPELILNNSTTLTYTSRNTYNLTLSI